MLRDHQRPGDPSSNADDQTDLTPPSTRPPPRSPSHAERCRTLAAEARAATLATIARDPEGFPYGSLVTVAVDASGRPLLLLSQLAEHTQNLEHRADASILLTEPLDRHRQPLALGRVTLLGACRPLPAEDVEEARRTFLATQPDAATYVDFKDFSFYRLEPTSLRYVGGFGRMSWVRVEDYLAAEPDPLRAAAAGILSHMNQDHADALLAYARGLARIPEASAATMTAVDRYGFDLAVTTPNGPRATRLAFDHEVSTSDEVRKAVIAMVKAARALLA
jgi:putative heme iron utilization protein